MSTPTRVRISDENHSANLAEARRQARRVRPRTGPLQRSRRLHFVDPEQPTLPQIELGGSPPLPPLPYPIPLPLLLPPITVAGDEEVAYTPAEWAGICAALDLLWGAGAGAGSIRRGSA